MAEFTQKVRSRQNVCRSQTLIAPHKKETQSPVWPRALSCFLLVLIDSVSLHVSTPPPSLTAAVCSAPPWRPQRRPSTGSCVRELVVWRGGRKVTRQAERLVVSGGCQDAWPPALDITEDGWVSARPLRLSCLSRLAIQEVMFSERLKDYFLSEKGRGKLKDTPESTLLSGATDLRSARRFSAAPKATNLRANSAFGYFFFFILIINPSD